MKLYSPLILKAMQIAYDAHIGQTDKNGCAYIYHPAYLAAQMDTQEEIITALLHDVVEDTDITFEDLRKDGFPEDVLEALRLLTHDSNQPYMDYVRRIARNPIAKKIKLADLLHNSNKSRSAALPKEKTALRIKKYKEAIEYLQNIDSAQS